MISLAINRASGMRGGDAMAAAEHTQDFILASNEADLTVRTRCQRVRRLAGQHEERQ